MKRRLVALALCAPLLTGCGALRAETEAPPAALGLVGAPLAAPAPTPAPAPHPDAPVGAYAVQRVVDGDTLYVAVNGKNVGIRVIGIDTPETKHPRMGVECYGPEASERAKELLTGQTVIISADITQGNKDKYGRLLRTITLPDGTDFGQRMLSTGHATEYTYRKPYDKRESYLTAQSHAADELHGMWGECVGA